MSFSLYLCFFRNHWKSHIAQSHSEETEWKCTECDKCFPDNHSLLYTHIIYNHQMGQFSCSKNDCMFDANLRITVVRHYRKHHLSHLPTTVKLPVARPSSAVTNATRSKYSILAIQCLLLGCNLEFATKDKDRFYRHSLHVHGLMPNRCLAAKCGRSFGEL